MGYSLVGVYPCAVWKQRCSSCNNNNNNISNSQTGPVRTRVANTARPHPYHQQQHQQHQPVLLQPVSTTTTNTAAAGVQHTPQLLVTTCSCREGIGTADYIPQAATIATTPMIFVPFTVPNYVANGCSPSSKVKKIILRKVWQNIFMYDKWQEYFMTISSKQILNNNTVSKFYLVLFFSQSFFLFLPKCIGRSITFLNIFICIKIFKISIN